MLLYFFSSYSPDLHLLTFNMSYIPRMDRQRERVNEITERWARSEDPITKSMPQELTFKDVVRFPRVKAVVCLIDEEGKILMVCNTNNLRQTLYERTIETSLKTIILFMEVDDNLDAVKFIVMLDDLLDKADIHKAKPSIHKSDKVGVYIGRMQPFHNGHLGVIKQAFSKKFTKLIIIIGSVDQAPTTKNPFNYEQRKQMIYDSVAEGIGVDEANSLMFVGVRDYYYNELAWENAVRASVSNLAKDNRVTLIGHTKDASSYYLRSFPEWDFSEIMDTKAVDGTGINATNIRKMLFEGAANSIKPLVSKATFEALLEFADLLLPDSNERKTTHVDNAVHYDPVLFDTLKEEYYDLRAYKSQQLAYPYPIIFSTVDAVIVRSGHILVVRRKNTPGKGLLALPGGFLGHDEQILDATIREVMEETNFTRPTRGNDTSYNSTKDMLLSNLVTTQVFSHPDRSLRGRTITHASLFNLGNGQLPVVKGGDDAADAFWMPIHEAIESPAKFFDDHASICFYMTRLVNNIYG